MASKKTRSPRAYQPSTHYKPVRAITVARYRGPLVSPISPVLQRRPNMALNLIEDRRRWHPERWGRPLLGTVRSATRVVVKPSVGPALTSHLKFADPRRVIICIRRKIRREVLLALGKGGGGNKSPRRKPSSEVSC